MCSIYSCGKVVFCLFIIKRITWAQVCGLQAKIFKFILNRCINNQSHTSYKSFVHTPIYSHFIDFTPVIEWLSTLSTQPINVRTKGL
jgi:hypothetical protein